MLHYHYVHIYHDQSKIVVKIVSKFVVTNMVTFKSELGSLALRICARPSLKYRPGLYFCHRVRPYRLYSASSGIWWWCIAVIQGHQN